MATRFKNGVVKYFKDNIGIIIALVAMFIFLTVFPTTRSTFLTPKNMFNILRQNASNLFLATGMTMVIILGGYRPFRRVCYRSVRCCGAGMRGKLRTSGRLLVYRGSCVGAQ